jgi:tetratricopeptide (TPR) repeat protein
VLLLVLFASATSGLGLGSRRDLADYLMVAAYYRAGDRETALREIRKWGSSEIRAQVLALRRESDRLRAEPADASEIDLRTVEAAALMHAEAGLLELRSLNAKRSEGHLAAAASLVEWTHRVAASRRDPDGTPAVGPDLVLEPTIDRRDFYVALASGALSIGFPEKALPFAETATRTAPEDAEAWLLSGCAKEGLALEAQIGGHEGDVSRLREEAEKRFRQALIEEPTLLEARLRLGGVLLLENRPSDAEPVLREVVVQARDDAQRYLALLFLGRARESRGDTDEAASIYRHAVETWPESQAARLALARCLEGSAGPSAARALVEAGLLTSQNPDRSPDPWRLYPFGPRGLAKAAVERLWQEALGP